MILIACEEFCGVPEKLAFRLNGTRRTPFAECRLVGGI